MRWPTKTCRERKLIGSLLSESVCDDGHDIRPGLAAHRWRCSVPLSFRPATAYRAIPSDTHRRHHRPRLTMAELIDGHVSVKQCEHAVTALMEYALKRQEKREENELLPGKEESIWLQVSVKEIHGEAKLKPHRMCVETPQFPLSRLMLCVGG